MVYVCSSVLVSPPFLLNPCRNAAMSYKPLSAERVQDLSDVANKIRIHSVTCTKAANSG